MGVDRTSYLIYGFKFTNENEKSIIDDNYEELMEEEPYSKKFNNSDSDQVLVVDYMCGDYVYVGIKLAELDEYDDEEEVEIDKNKIKNLESQLYEYMESWPEYLINICKKKSPKLYFFIHAY